MQEADVIRFWTDDGDCWGFLFHHLTATHYSARNRRLLIRLGSRYSGCRRSESPGFYFYDDSCTHRATSLKADAKDILSVTMHLRAEADAEADAQEIVPSIMDEDLSLGGGETI